MAKRQASRQSPARRVGPSAGRAAASAERTVKEPAKPLRSGRARQETATRSVTEKANIERKPRAARPRGDQPPATQKARRKPAASDIPLDQVEATYTLTQSGSKAAFHDDGRDRQADQEFGNGIFSERFSEEDALTNKSGDPHIGTHHRTSRLSASRTKGDDNRRTIMDTPFGNAGFGTTSASEGERMAGTSGTTCAACGQPLRGSAINTTLDEFLGRLGISDEMIRNLRTSMANVDVEEYLNTARDYLQANSGKAKDYARENPGKVAAGVAVLAAGAGLLFSALRRD